MSVHFPSIFTARRAAMKTHPQASVRSKEIHSISSERRSERWCYRLLALMLIIVYGCLLSQADNYVSYEVSDSIMAEASPRIIKIVRNNESKNILVEHPDLEEEYDKYNIPHFIHPYDDRERWSSINFKLLAPNQPIRIMKVEWVRNNPLNDNNIIIDVPIMPFSLDTIANDKEAKSIIWNIHLEYPFKAMMYEDEELILFTDKGIVREYIDENFRIKRDTSLLQEKYKGFLKEKNNGNRTLLIGLAIGASVLIILCIIIFFVVRRRMSQKIDKIRELSLLMAERTNRNLELEAKVSQLYGSRLDTLNLLCNEYFDSKESDEKQMGFFNEVEKHILALRDPKQLEQLEAIVNGNTDNIMSRVKEQIPELNKKDLAFLTYLYAGFSLRAICIFTDLKLQSFYKRRSRLKEKILNSDAPDKEFFASKMDV